MGLLKNLKCILRRVTPHFNDLDKRIKGPHDFRARRQYSDSCVEVVYIVQADGHAHAIIRLLGST